MAKSRYDLLKDNGRTEPWTGVFKNDKEADYWYKIHGQWWKEQGRKFVKVTVR